MTFKIDPGRLLASAVQTYLEVNNPKWMSCKCRPEDSEWVCDACIERERRAPLEKALQSYKDQVYVKRT